MRMPVYMTQFKRDIKKVQKRAYNMEKIKHFIHMLLEEIPLPISYHDHALVGNWHGFRELHIE